MTMPQLELTPFQTVKMTVLGLNRPLLPNFPSHPLNLALICREVGAPADRTYSFPDRSAVRQRGKKQTIPAKS